MFRLLILLILTYKTPVVVVHSEPELWPGAKLVHNEIQTLTTNRVIYILKTESSPGGMHDLKIKYPLAIISGGYFEACYSNAIKSLVENSNYCPILVLPLKCIFVGDKRTLYDVWSDKYKHNIREFCTYISNVSRSKWGINIRLMYMVGDNVILLGFSTEKMNEDR